jgi:hypothetical protein
MIMIFLAMAALLAPLPFVLLDVAYARPPRAIGRAPLTLTTRTHVGPRLTVPVVPGRGWSA